MKQLNFNKINEQKSNFHVILLRAYKPYAVIFTNDSKDVKISVLQISDTVLKNLVNCKEQNKIRKLQSMNRIAYVNCEGLCMQQGRFKRFQCNVFCLLKYLQRNTSTLDNHRQPSFE